MSNDNEDNIIHQMVFGAPGYCERCGLMKKLAMVAMPGMHEDEETGEPIGGTLHLDPHERRGYCFDCAPIILEEINRKDA